MLPGTKDIQEYVLTDPKCAAVVDIIDVIQCQYRVDGSLYAPKGGQSLAQRQYARIMEVGETSFAQTYRAVQEFRSSHPDKAIVYSRRGDGLSHWAAFMGGASLVSLPEIENMQFLKDAASMTPLKEKEDQQYLLGNNGKGYIIFSETGKVNFDVLQDASSYSISWINPVTGEVHDSQTRVVGRSKALKAPFKGPAVAWLIKQ
jgi:hypothetical protein